MEQSSHTIGGLSIPLYSANTLVIGSGAAALNAAINLHRQGVDALVATESWGGGTSANAGSDKQTYYKLALAGGTGDSPRQLAADLARGGCMHGDIALAEASHSAQAFYNLVALGVPFPHDAYGGFPGYRTDHDTRGRATSAGPLTSRLMVEALGREVKRLEIPVLDGLQVVALVVDREGDRSRIAGAIGIHLRKGAGAGTGEDTRGLDERGRDLPAWVLFNARSVVLATGGPGAMYADSVYPADQVGSIGLALRIGAAAQNLTESQFGLASIGFRWNLSGSYQQVVPRYVSTDADGGSEREFLRDAFPTSAASADAVFRKGYEWPFDPRKVAGFGSSLVDLLVYRERVERKRRVFLDYTRDPAGDLRAEQGAGPARSKVLDLLSPEAREYLQRSGATGATPIERLARLNQPAIDLYRSHGIDLARDRLEIAVCAQHNNGGLAANHWWESNVEGLFPIGEVNGSHGVYRPGGAALNAGQVGGLRAALFIARRRGGPPIDAADFLDLAGEQVRETIAAAARWRAAPAGAPDTSAVRAEIQARMSRAGALVRSAASVKAACAEAWALHERLRDGSAARDECEVAEAFRNLDMALAHALYLQSIAEYIERAGRSRGSYVVLDAAGTAACEALGDAWRFSLTEPGAFVNGHVLEIAVGTDGKPRTAWTPVRPIPDPDDWFENVWREYREDRVVR